MKKMVLGSLLLVLLAVSALADVLSLKEGHPETYVVKKGDTLWDISNMFLDDPWLWPELWHINPQIENPHLIYPGDVLKLVWIDGQPRLVVQRGQRGDVRLTPQIRSIPLDEAIPAIPLDVISPFLTRSRVVLPGVLEAAPYVLAAKGGRIVAGAGDEIYARGPIDEADDTYGIYRRGDAFVDPESEELLGVQALDIGTAKLLDFEDEIATLALNRTTEEVRRGDRLLPEEERKINANFFPSAPEQETNGYIIAVEGGVSQIGQMDVVVLNKGAREELQEGHVLAIYKTGELVRDQVANEVVRVPDRRAGLLMIFRTFDRVSYALVLKAQSPLAVGDKIRNP